MVHQNDLGRELRHKQLLSSLQAIVGCHLDDINSAWILLEVLLDGSLLVLESLALFLELLQVVLWEVVSLVLGAPSLLNIVFISSQQKDI